MDDLNIFLAIVAVAVVSTVVVVLARPAGSREMMKSTPLDFEAGAQRLASSAPAATDRLLESADRRTIGGGVALAAFAVLFTTAALVGWIFSGIGDGSGVARWDSSAAEFGRDRATDASTRLFGAVTDLGGTLYLFVLMALIAVYHAVRRSDAGPLVYLVTVGVGVSLLNNGLKLLIDRDRPDLAQLADSAGSSFPSGHTAAAAACWAAIAFVVARRRSTASRCAVAACAVVIAIAVAATRVLLGVHWLSDVAAGLLVGWGWWLATTMVFGGRALRLGAPAQTPTDSVPVASNTPLDLVDTRTAETSSR